MAEAMGFTNVMAGDEISTHGSNCRYGNETSKTHGFNHGKEERMSTTNNLISETISPRF